ncbi:hypothetical protein AK88_03561 [Plasmodium fragile]|uniref:Plasmodium RESA N-terminal domain-containing protein n=1 Tax=Plasmodium fragile TaxID=5857 RepID=A0A0D9QIY1_PLAFR|nr:uncharacterized protein AK88_03561 [Plasmodium fragile]KJP86747.1 hypothetical protein AK88_03561 [Plasmodium fragile]
MQECYPLRPILFDPLKFVMGKNNKLGSGSPQKNAFAGHRGITGDKEKSTFSVFTFSGAILCALALSLFYTLIQNVHCPGWPRDNYHGIHDVRNGRRWRNLSACIPSHVKAFRKLHLTEDGQMVFHPRECSGRDTDVSPEIQKIYKDVERSFSGKYTNVLTEREKKRGIKNVMLFRDHNSQDMTDEELSEKINKLKGPVDTMTMLCVLNYVHNHEKEKYIRMMEDMQEACGVLADSYNVPWEYEAEKFKYVHDKMMKMLMKREKFEMKNIKAFATDEPICARWEFQRYLELKRRSWADFTRRMKRQGTNRLQHSFRRTKHMDICWM